MNWTWADYEPHYNALKSTEVTSENAEAWLKDWTKLSDLLGEVGNRLYVATSVNTADEVSEKQLQTYLRDIAENSNAEEELLRQKLIASGVSVSGMENAMRQIKSDSDLFCAENLPLSTELADYSMEYDKLCGSRSVEWDGKEITLPEADMVLEENDRSRREAAWKAKHNRILADRQPLNELWTKMFAVREKIAANKGMANFEQYMWQALHRFDYTPDDCASFRQAILDHVVPAAKEVYEIRKRRLNLDTIKPWDLDVDIYADEPLRPFASEAELLEKSKKIFDDLDPELGEYFQDMIDNKLIDLYARKNKANGGYCTSFPTAKKPFVFMNAVGSHDNLQTLIHEAGHCFHVYETADLPYKQQGEVGSEFAEVASMGMEMLSHAYFHHFYNEKEAARAQIAHLERQLLFWPYMAVVDGFQHWAYTSGQGSDPVACDAKWAELWDQFMAGIDYTGLEDIKATGWHRKLHIYQVPFYYVEYGLAQVGALQVWLNAKKDEKAAVAAYRSALSLGCTKPLPDLFKTAGGKFAFDGATIKELVDTMVAKVRELEKVIG